MKDAIFRDSEGSYWHIDIKYGDICRVRQHVQGADDKPLDLCLIAETGNFKQVTDHFDILVRSTYWLLSKDIQEYSGKSGIEAMEWFYARIDSNALESMAQAWYEGLINFTPSQVVRAAMTMAWEETKQEELIEAINLLAGRLATYTNTEESSELTPDNSVMVNLQRWLNPI